MQPGLLARNLELRYLISRRGGKTAPQKHKHYAQNFVNFYFPSELWFSKYETISPLINFFIILINYVLYLAITVVVKYSTSLY